MAKNDYPQQRVAELAPDEEIVHLLACDHGKGNDGWLVATDRRIWWVTKKRIIRGGETEEMPHGLVVNVIGIPLSRRAVLEIGDECFQMKKDQAEEFARVLRGLRG